MAEHGIRARIDERPRRLRLIVREHRGNHVDSPVQRHQHDIGPGDHVLLAAAPEYGLVVIHTRQAMNEMLARYHSTFGSPDRQEHE